jgi:processive 1,2-diacylglycerol beta-glucosyltransferase
MTLMETSVTTANERSNPLVLIISASVGAGHNQAAKALIEALKQAAPNVEVKWVDSMDLVPRAFRAYYSGGFGLICSKLPRLYGLLFRMTNRPQTAARGPFETVRLWVERRCLRRIRQVISETRPDLIINTHFLAAPLIGYMLAKGQTKSPQAVVITDIDVHRWWYASNVDRWFAPHPCSGLQVQRWSIPQSRVTVSGIPIHPKWVAPLDRGQVLAQWKLPADKPIILLAGGAEYTAGPVVQIAKGLLDACPKACLVVLGGRNKALLGDLGRLAATHPNLVPVAFTDKAHELVGVCSLMITKAGGLTTAECLSKGTPMVLLKPVPGQEGGNSKFFQDEGAAIITSQPAEIIAAARELLASPQRLESLSQNARRLYRPGTQTIVQYIIDRLK